MLLLCVYLLLLRCNDSRWISFSFLHESKIWSVGCKLFTSWLQRFVRCSVNGPGLSLTACKRGGYGCQLSSWRWSSVNDDDATPFVALPRQEWVKPHLHGLKGSTTWLVLMDGWSGGHLCPIKESPDTGRSLALVLEELVAAWQDPTTIGLWAHLFSTTAGTTEPLGYSHEICPTQQASETECKRSSLKASTIEGYGGSPSPANWPSNWQPLHGAMYDAGVRILSFLHDHCQSNAWVEISFLLIPGSVLDSLILNKTMTAIHFSNTEKQFSIMISDDSTIPSPESKLEGEKKMYANIRFLFSDFNKKAIPSTRIHNEIDLTHLHRILLVSSVVFECLFFWFCPI